MNFWSSCKAGDFFTCGAIVTPCVRTNDDHDLIDNFKNFPSFNNSAKSPYTECYLNKYCRYSIWLQKPNNLFFYFGFRFFFQCLFVYSTLYNCFVLCWFCKFQAESLKKKRVIMKNRNARPISYFCVHLICARDRVKIWFISVIVCKRFHFQHVYKMHMQNDKQNTQIVIFEWAI